MCWWPEADARFHRKSLMGLFDFFSRGSNSRSPAGTEPRCDHYSFAHVVLRKAAFENPTLCVTSLASPDGRQYLAELWDNVVTTCREHEQPVEITLDDILIHKLRVGTFPCTLLELPSPRYSTEVFFVAIILTVDMTADTQNISGNSVRYLTLENSEPHDEEVHTVLGEWSAEGIHYILGTGPYPELSEFVAAITELFDQRNFTE